MNQPLFEITKKARFEAAHRLQGGPPAYARVHGHSFEVEATLAGPAEAPMGWVEDLATLETVLATVAGELDHSLLNEHPGLETPTLEALCLFFAGRLKGEFPRLRRIAVSRPSVGERCAMEVG